MNKSLLLFLAAVAFLSFSCSSDTKNSNLCGNSVIDIGEECDSQNINKNVTGHKLEIPVAKMKDFIQVQLFAMMNVNWIIPIVRDCVETASSNPSSNLVMASS
jgi:hypothetical protein